MAREGFEDYKMLDVYQDLHEHIFSGYDLL